MKHIIDTNRDIQSLLPKWVKEVVENKAYGKVEWNKKSVELYLSEKQKNGYISGTDLLEEMKDKNPVNLAFLQFFVDNPKLYPKEWRKKYIYGWGTIVRHDGGLLRVPYLIEYGDEVVLYWGWLDVDWSSGNPALRFASISPQNSNVSSLEPLSFVLESAIKICKENGYQVAKIY